MLFGLVFGFDDGPLVLGSGGGNPADDLFGDSSAVYVPHFDNNVDDALGITTTAYLDAVDYTTYSVENGENVLNMGMGGVGQPTGLIANGTIIYSATMQMYWEDSLDNGAYSYVIDAQGQSGGWFYIDPISGSATIGSMTVKVNGTNFVSNDLFPKAQWVDVYYESSAMPNTGNIVFGGMSHDFPCKIKNLRCYNRVLTPEEQATSLNAKRTA